ncbi:hypothetical protein L2E82_33630 [Cichorium intybus]|uniref:Uncharacterized protein n=1 Tax=Cichorium intybus TaxID=13427 RepID=A0ACB9BKQ6_CICIN|nr:hypothetical protein L2E82_33630 [Cichorium intybus]
MVMVTVDIEAVVKHDVVVDTGDQENGLVLSFQTGISMVVDALVRKGTASGVVVYMIEVGGVLSLLASISMVVDALVMKGITGGGVVYMIEVGDVRRCVVAECDDG